MSAFEGIAAVLAIAALGIRLAGRQHRLLHLLQLEHYEGARLMLWLRRRRELLAPRELLATCLLFAAAVAASANGSRLAVRSASCSPVAPWPRSGVGDWRREAIKPLVFTARAKRLLAAALLAPACSSSPRSCLPSRASPPPRLPLCLADGVLLLAAAPWTLLRQPCPATAPAGDQPTLEERAKRSLREWDPLVVGITGSYGKTTTKFCVGAVLEADRPTLVTPESYNSYLGVLRTINEHLRAAHKRSWSRWECSGAATSPSCASSCTQDRRDHRDRTDAPRAARLDRGDRRRQGRAARRPAPGRSLHHQRRGPPLPGACRAGAGARHVVRVEHDDPRSASPARRPRRPARRPARPLPSLQNNDPPAHIVARNMRLADGRTTFTSS